MEVLLREACTVCGGSGLNGLSQEEAQKQIDSVPRGGVLNIHSQTLNNKESLFWLMTCGHCVDGYTKRWVTVNELLSLGSP